MKLFPLTIRWKMGLWSAALATAVIAIFCATTFWVLYDEQIEGVDLEVKSVARNLLASSGAPSPEDIGRLPPWIKAAAFDHKGAPGVRSEGFADTLAHLRPGRRTPFTIKHQGHSWRLASFPAGQGTLGIAYDLSEVHEITEDLVGSSLVSLPLVLGIALAGCWWVSGHVLRPVHSLTESAACIGTDDLSRRIPLPAAKDEVRQLADVLNSMLERIERGFRQAERFSADASHELRTPLTVIRGEVERLLATPGLPREQEDRLVGIQEEIARLSQLTDSLLLLARFDAGLLPSLAAPVDLSGLALEVCEDGSLLAAASDLTFEHRIQPGLQVSGDAAQLRRLLLNLIDNACRHNHPGGRVLLDLSGAKEEEGVVLSVSNTGAGIPRELRSRVFERFFRADASRTSGGHGLGLSLCHEIARAHGGKLTLDDTPQNLTRFVLTLPLRQAPPLSARV